MGPQNQGIYDPKDVNLVIQSRTLAGFGEDEMVRTERLDDNEATIKVGAKGDYTFQINQNKAGMIIVTLNQNSPDHIFLQSLKESRAIFSVVVTSKHNFKELASLTQAMVAIAPRKTYGKEVSEREWQFVGGELIETDKAL